jgi:serine/threonine-protein kinase HipA
MTTMPDAKRLGVSVRDVQTPQGLAGSLAHETQFVFNYANRDPACALSLTMPVRALSYAHSSIPPILAMNLPEGARLQHFKRLHPKLDAMGMLSVLGSCQLGRLSLAPLDTTAPAIGAQIGLKELVACSASQDLFSRLENAYGIAGISGTQPKVLVPDADRTSVKRRGTSPIANLIVKKADPEYPHLCANEYTCLDAARRGGIEVPNHWLSEDGGLLVLERFDIADNGGQFGFEDIATLSQRPYDEAGRYRYDGSYEGIVNVIEAFAGAHSVAACQRFFAYFVFCCMVRNGDAHLKNFGLLYDAPHQPETVRLAPLYDVVTTAAYDFDAGRHGVVEADRSLALRFRKSMRYPTRKDILAFAPRCFVRQPEKVIERLGVAMGESLAVNRDRFSRKFYNRLRAEWDAGRRQLESPKAIYASSPGQTHRW